MIWRKRLHLKLGMDLVIQIVAVTTVTAVIPIAVGEIYYQQSKHPKELFIILKRKNYKKLFL